MPAEQTVRVYKVKPQQQTAFQYILFDLDETLYPREAGLMDVIRQRIFLYMIQKVGIPPDDVTTRQHYYFQHYGTSLRGLMAEYGIDPLEFLTFVHDLNPGDFLGASPPLQQMLAEIPLNKVIFTNADTGHAERVLNALRVREHFDRIIDICRLNYECKPDPQSYRRVLDILDVPGSACIMVDDIPRNLIPAKDAGMTTILIDPAERPSIAIDYVVPTIFHVERVLQELLPNYRE